MREEYILIKERKNKKNNSRCQLNFLNFWNKFKSIIEIKHKLPVLQYSVRGEEHGLIYPYLS